MLSVSMGNVIEVLSKDCMKIIELSTDAQFPGIAPNPQEEILPNRMESIKNGDFL